jgi:uncharacterized membrane protein
MSRKWLEKEGRRWLELQIITQEQLEQILKLYPSKKFGIGVLPIFGGLLVGLGVLTFVAANWQEIPQWFRLGLIIAVMCGFYWSGERSKAAGYHRIGEALAGAGLLTFGAGIFLVGQMYHLTSYSVISFLIWGIVGLLLTYLYRSRFMFFLTTLILVIAQSYGYLSFISFSSAAALITLIGLGGFVWLRSPKWMEAFLLSGALLVHLLYFLNERNWNEMWFYVLLAFLYALSDWMPASGAKQGFRSFAVSIGFLYGLWMVMVGDWLGLSMKVPASLYWMLLPYALFMGVSIWKKIRNEDLDKGSWTIVEWLPLLPLFLVKTGGIYVYLIALWLFSLYLLFYGYRIQNRRYANWGTAGFIAVVLVAYTKLTWAFMDKSMFFISAGLLLLGLSGWLYRRNKTILVGNEGEGGHDE